MCGLTKQNKKVKKRKQKFVTDNEGGDGFTVTKTTTNTQEKSVEIKATPQSPIVPAVVCIIIAYSLLAMTGCTTARKATNYFNNHEDTAAGYCAVKYPVKTFTKTVTHTVQGKSDTVTVPGETVYADCSEEVIKALDNAARSHVAVKCPPTKIISKHDTTYVHDTTVSENTAQLRACQLKQNEIESYLQATIKEREKYKADKRTWQGRALWTWGILLLLIIVAIVLKWVSSKLP